MSSSLVPSYTTSENEDENSESDDDDIDHAAMMKPLNSSIAATLIGGVSSGSMSTMDLAPAVISKNEIGGTIHVDPTTKQLHYNPKYEQLFKPMVRFCVIYLSFYNLYLQAGPLNPYKTASQQIKKNMLTGFVEAAHINPFHFEREIRTFDTHGYARDPSADASNLYVGDVKKAEANLGVGVFDSKKTGGEKRRRAYNFDASDVDGYTGPWGGYEVEERVSKPDADTLKVMEEFMRKKRKMSKANKKAVADAGLVEETSTLHCMFIIYFTIYIIIFQWKKRSTIWVDHGWVHRKMQALIYAPTMYPIDVIYRKSKFTPIVDTVKVLTVFDGFRRVHIYFYRVVWIRK